MKTELDVFTRFATAGLALGCVIGYALGKLMLKEQLPLSYAMAQGKQPKIWKGPIVINQNGEDTQQEEPEGENT